MILAYIRISTSLQDLKNQKALLMSLLEKIILLKLKSLLEKIKMNEK